MQFAVLTAGVRGRRTSRARIRHAGGYARGRCPLVFQGVPFDVWGQGDASIAVRASFRKRREARTWAIGRPGE
jgi:hypothetical protein